MTELHYVRASQISEAVAMLNEPGIKGRPLAGGTDLLILMRTTPNICERLVDISLIPELHVIRQEGDQVSIGAAATFREVLEDPIVAKTAPVLIQACASVGAVQIRNMGTLGGNICNAAVCADSLPALVCLESKAHIYGTKGERILPVAELVIGPNQTQILPGELLVRLSYPVPHPSSRSVFLKLGRRNAMAISRLTVAVLGRLDNQGRIAEARIVPGAVAPQTARVKAAEDLLLGQLPCPDLFEAAARRMNEELVRLVGRRWSSEFKEPALLAITKRALTQVFSASASGNQVPA